MTGATEPEIIFEPAPEVILQEHFSFSAQVRHEPDTHGRNSQGSESALVLGLRDALSYKFSKPRGGIPLRLP